MITNIVLATDGSSSAGKALNTAIDMAAKYDAKLTIVHVLTHDHPSAELRRMLEVEHLEEPRPVQKDKSGGTSSAVGRLLKAGMDSEEIRAITVLGEQIVNAASKAAKKAGVKDVDTIIREGDYANSILEVADSIDADMIVIGRRGLSKLKGFVTGSVSNKVSQRANCSVLTVK
jgi:nucleotide-binding universal stress UspA family protein